MSVEGVDGCLWPVDDELDGNTDFVCLMLVDIGVVES